MGYPTMEEARLYLRVEHERDDALIEGLIEAARDYIERYQGRVYADEHVPQVNRQAALMLIAHWYENREAVSTGGNNGKPYPVPYGAEALISLNKRVTV